MKGKKETTGEDLFVETKIKLVMKLYGLSRGQAIARVSERKAKSAKAIEADHGIEFMKRKKSLDDGMMTAEEFFAEV